jgi:hypothetical protein
VVDVFHEVDEQIREERFRALMRRVVPLFIGAMVVAVLAVLGLWGYKQFSLGAIGKSSEAYAHGLELLQQGDQNGAFAQFDQAAKGPAGYHALALIQEGAIRQMQNKTTDAVALFDQAAKAAPDKMIADAASLKAAYALLDTASLTDMTQRLTPLIAADRPYHAQAREALALAKIGAGQLSQAKSDLGVIQLMTDTPDSERQRAGALITLIDSGTAKSLKALAQAPILAPPPAPPQDAQAPQDVQVQPAPQSADTGN